MFRTNRLQSGHHSRAATALLAAGTFGADSSIESDDLQGSPLELNGTLHGNKTVLFLGPRTPLAADSQVVIGAISYFDTCGRLSALGKVSGSFGPNNATNAPAGQLPNLSNLTLELSNHAGSVQLSLAPSTTNRYQFKVAGGTGSYGDAFGWGSLTITVREGSNDYLLSLRSVKR